MDYVEHGSRRAGPMPVQGFSMLAGLLFLVLGAAGLIPGVTVDGVAAGGQPASLLFGLFAVSAVHNLVHLLSGVVAVFCAGSARRSRMFLLVAGLLYLAFCLFGLFVPDSMSTLLPMNNADNWLNLGLGTAMLVAYASTTGRTSPPVE